MPHYKNAPIEEAVIDLRVEWPAAAPTDVFDRLTEQLKERFAKVDPIRTIEMGVQQQAGQEPAFVAGTDIVGRRFDSTTPARVLQLQRVGFTYSHLRPYSEWISFSSEASGFWREYVEAAGIRRVTRVAVRVINKIALSAPLRELSRYTNILPQVPDGLLGTGDAYFLQLQSPGRVEGSRVVLNSGLARNADTGWEFLLDFDLFVERVIDAQSAELWDILGRLSSAKNDLFETCITDDFRRLIK